jgi:hypothetical protein
MKTLIASSSSDQQRNATGSPRLELLHNSKLGEVSEEPNKITVKNNFTIEKVGDLWLLRSLADREVEVNGVPTVASFLEGGETIASGDLRYRLVPSGESTGPKDKRAPLPWLELILPALIGFGFWLWQRQPASKERIVLDAPSLSKEEPPIQLAANPEEAEIQARLILKHCVFDLREYQSNDGYLHHVISDLSYLTDALAGRNVSPDLRQEVETTLRQAKQTYSEEVKRLRDNAIIAHASGQPANYKKILGRLTRLIVDPRDPVYRWALLRLQVANS